MGRNIQEFVQKKKTLRFQQCSDRINESITDPMSRNSLASNWDPSTSKRRRFLSQDCEQLDVIIRTMTELACHVWRHAKPTNAGQSDAEADF